MDVSIDPAVIVERIEPFVTADPVRATTLGTIATVLRDGTAADLAGWCASVPGAIAARSQAQTPVNLLGDWVDFDELVEALLELRPQRVNGPQRLVDPVAHRLSAEGARQHSRIDERLFRLDQLVDPLGVRGSARKASGGDAALLGQWWTAFVAEAGIAATAQEIAANVERVIRTQRQWIWLDERNHPVSMAGGRLPVAGSARVGPVYTPVEHRGQGFGSAVTAQATREVLTAGAIPVLFTDRANPTSNKIYQQLGYHGVEDCALVRFEWTV